MTKRILIISTSPRKNGNSDALSEAFAAGARQSGHFVEKVELYNKNIGFCKGCLVCQQTQHCVLEDDASYITQQMKNAEVVVFATPIYYYEMCGQMKTMLDRANPLYSSDYAFRSVYLLASAADPSSDAMDQAVQGLKSWVRCFSKSHFKKALLASSVSDIGDIKNNPALAKAFQLGQQV